MTPEDLEREVEELDAEVCRQEAEELQEWRSALGGDALNLDRYQRESVERIISVLRREVCRAERAKLHYSDPHMCKRRHEDALFAEDLANHLVGNIEGS